MAQAVKASGAASGVAERAGGAIRARAWLGLGVIAATMALSACNRDPILPGVREDIRPEEEILASRGANRAQPIALPAPRGNADWPQGHGTPSTRVDHASLPRIPALAWAAPIGEGDGRRNRITAAPVVAGGRVFTLDSEATVTATSTGGGRLWQTDLRPATDAGRDATGGGIAFGGGRVYVSSGFGLLTALDPATGAVLWQQRLEAVGNGAPTYYDGVVYLVAGDATGWALEADTGRIRWQLSSAPDVNNLLGGPAPAVTGEYAVFGFGSGEVQGTFRKGGLRLWEAIVGGRRLGYARANVGDISGSPVIVGDTVYAGSHSGRMVAIDVASGARKWTADEGAMSPVWVTGGSVFLVSDRNELVRLDAATGDRIWGAELPFFTASRPRRQSETFAHYGPILAGGRIVVASNDGFLRFFDPATGSVTASVPVAGGATTEPVVAGGVLYVVNTRGELLAYR